MTGADGSRDTLRSTTASLAAAVRVGWAASAGWLVTRVTLGIAMSAVPVAGAWLTKAVLDRVVRPGAPLLAPVLALALAGVAAAFLPQAMQYADAQLERAVELVARERLYAAVARMRGLRRLEDPRFHDRLSLAADRGTAGPAEVIGGGLGAAQGVLTLGGFFGTLAVLNRWMLLAVVAAAMVAFHGELRLARHRARMLWQLGHASRRELFYAQLLTSTSAAQELRLYGLGGLFRERMLAELRRINRRRQRMDRRELLVQGAHGVVGAAVAGVGLVWAVGAARAGALTIGDVPMFVAAVAGVQASLTIIVSSLGRMHEALLMFGHYRHVVGAGPDLPEPSRNGARRPVPGLRRGIELRGVWFRYADDLPWVLRDVSMTLPAGRATALVGPNGAGKSTVVKLLCRFYDPTRGAVLWDGVDLRELPVEELRRRIGTVFQDFMAYELTAADNIGVGDQAALADRDRIVAAARRAGCHGLLAGLPRGYDTMLTRIYILGEREDPSTGVILSGGQWQRVAVARALLRDQADLLIMDEPSAGLDAEAEHELHLRLRELRAGRTSLLVSHRLSTIRDADTIVVLSGGTVAECGTHDQLRNTDGLYARLFNLQAAGYQEHPEQVWP